MAAFNYKQEYQRYKKYYLNLVPLLQQPVSRAYTTIIFSFLAISLFGWYAIRPTMQTIFELKREIADKTDLNQKMEEKISALIEAQAVYQDIETKIPVVTDALPTTPDAIRALGQIQSLARESNVQLTSISVPTVPLVAVSTASGQKAGPTKVSDVAFTLAVTGMYPDIKNFLEGIVDLRRVTQIESMTFLLQRELSPEATQSATPTGTKLQVDLKLNIYYLST